MAEPFLHACLCLNLEVTCHSCKSGQVPDHIIHDKRCLLCSLVEGELLDEYMSNAREKQNIKQYVETVKTAMKKMLQVCSSNHSHCLLSALHCYGSYVDTAC